MTRLAMMCLALGLTATTAVAGPLVAPQPLPKLPAARIAVGPPPGSQAAQDLVQQITMVADIIAANKTDCAAMAAALQAFDTQNGPAIQADEAMLNGLTAAERQAATDPVKLKMTHVSEQIQANLQRCGQDKGVEAAMRALGNMP